MSEKQTATHWRVRWNTPDRTYAFAEICWQSQAPMTRAEAYAYGKRQVKENPTRYASVSDLYPVDVEGDAAEIQRNRGAA